MSGSKITRVGLPDTNLNQLTVDQLAQGASLQQRVPNPYFGIIPRSSSLGDPTIPVRAVAQAVSAVHDGQPLSQQRRHDDLSRLLRQARAALLARAVVSRQLHALEADGRCLVGVRRVDPDGAGRQLSGGRQLQSPRSSATTRPATFRTCSWRRRSGTFRSAPTGAARQRRAGRARQRLDGDGRADAAVGRADRHHADDQQQRVRRVRDAASQSDRRSRASGRRAIGQPLVQHRARSRRRRRSPLARARAIRFAGPAIAISTSR